MPLWRGGGRSWAGDAELVGDLLNGVFALAVIAVLVIHLAGEADLARSEFGFLAAGASACSGGSEAVDRSLGHQRMLEFGDRAQYFDPRVACRSGAVGPPPAYRWSGRPGHHPHVDLHAYDLNKALSDHDDRVEGERRAGQCERQHDERVACRPGEHDRLDIAAAARRNTRARKERRPAPR